MLERWRPETHTFRLLYGECTITLEDVTLKLGLLVDGSVAMGSVVDPGKEDLCMAFLGKMSNKFYDVNRWLSAPAAIMGLAATTNFTYLGERLINVPIGEKVEPWPELYGTTLAAQRYLTAVKSTLGRRYIIECILSECFAKSEYVGHEGIVDSVCDDGNE
ncbi:hypothetical protein CXB51_002948 [Gossypium anomalum]|uniref:Aminotransferase-like plant mobile domain-containing protein n=1 Tax=Gossypium anomalum TaxID=47600 RepID=A0A8J6DB96_9ROSI|nr:hypothetical protein CXB51_002948 [Gossypium anomalum]